MDRIKTLEEHLDKLTDAHRALAAQHTALLEVCKLVLPLIPADPGRLQATLTIAYDTISALMQEHGQDDQYQAEVRKTFDALTERILGAADTPPAPPSPDARER